MSLFNRLKNLYGNMLTKHFNIFFLAMFTVLFICFIIGGAAMERTPLMVVDSGLHEFGHSMGMYLTGGNVTAIQINYWYDGFFINKNMSYASTSKEPGTGNHFISAISGPLLALIVSILLMNISFLRWYAVLMGGDSLLQIIPINPSNDGCHILYWDGPTMSTIAIFIFVILYTILIFNFTAYIIRRINGFMG
jgi:hypothetical protein